MACSLSVCVVNAHQLAAIVKNRIDNVLILDSRSFLEYNSSHIVNAINVGCAKLMKRRLQQEKLSIQDFLAQNCHWDVDHNMDIIVYDQSSTDGSCLSPDSFMAVFVQKLLPVYNSVNILKGGFFEFQSAYPNLCETEKAKFAPLTSLSQPCLPISNHGPTRILPFLYLGSQNDALNKEILQNHNITYELNVSTNCPKPDFIQESHFMRIPVIDNYSEKLLPYFPKAFQFLDKVKESGGCVLVHCLAGISRSATVAIAYVMKCLKMTSDEAYRYVKAKRTTISPNFNFLGQLLELEKQLQRDASLTASTAFKERNFGLEEKRSSFNVSSSQFSQQTCYSSYYSSSTMDNHSSFTKTSSEKTSFRETVDIACVPDGQPSTFSVKCIPVSSLKEICFTPCQTSFTTNQQYVINKVIVNNGGTVKSMLSPVNQDKKLDLSSASHALENCKMDGVRNFNSLSPELQQLKSFAFDPKSYVRSDSLSTSGLGSEGSDCADSWNDYSNEKETDILMDDDYGTVPTHDLEFNRTKVLGLEDSYDEALSLYPNYESSCGDSELKQRFHNFVNPSSSGNVQQRAISKTCKENINCPSNGISNCLLFAQNEAGAKELGKSHPLYRAQSCPGMLSSDASRASSIDRLIKAGSVALRKSRKNSSDKERHHNRYSCSSLDYMDYSTCSDFSHVSCPDVHVSNVPSNATPAALATSHRNFRHSMIQVS